MGITKAQLEAAQSRGAAIDAKYPRCVSVHVESGKIAFVFASGVELHVPLTEIQELATAKARDLAEFQISPSGHGVHFPKVDADVYLPTLIEGITGSRSWMAARNGSVGGKAKTAEKAAAARANGKLGGRPRKAIIEHS